MRATDPRPGLAAMPAERLAPAAAALASAYAEEMSAGPPPICQSLCPHLPGSPRTTPTPGSRSRRRRRGRVVGPAPCRPQ